MTIKDSISPIPITTSFLSPGLLENRIARGFKSQTKKSYGNKHRITDTKKSQHNRVQPSQSLFRPRTLLSTVSLKDDQSEIVAPFKKKCS
ncbi:hypothetical protein T05_14760 [Trichinella murrelli]|uniref:Uncharacterized protein n=1 Tax=Trichinella murrelli TaxID=144512 RepID=A0A0V0TK37_9BILA|nr:hypothetical protein T05_14760 [Trichinella murrelli]